MRTTFITVHGTGDQETAPRDAEPKWWESRSAFCQELLSRAPAGSTIEPFVWSGANDELARRRGARQLYRLVKANRHRGMITMIGHSHGGSVIALALRSAAADGDELKHVDRWMTVGSPFVQMRRRFLPWERYNVFGQAVLFFTFLAAFLFIYGLFSGDIFGDLYRYGGAAGIALCSLLLYASQYRVRFLYSKRSRRRFSAYFGSRWRGLVASHDEATSGLSRLPKIDVKLFDWTLLASTFRLVVSLTFIAVVFDFWAIGGGYSSRAVDHPLGDLPGVIAIINAHEALFGIESYLWNLTRGSGEFSASSIAAYAILVIIGYVVLLAALLKTADLFSRFTFGKLLAFGLNNSAKKTLLKKAYGNSTVGEHAFGVSTSPFETIPVATTMSSAANEALLAYARAHAAETLERIHDDLFRADEASPDRFLANELIKHLSWNEIVHTSYFKVPEARADIVADLLPENSLILG